MDGTHPTLPDTPFTLADDFRRDDEASVKDVRLAHVGFAGAAHRLILSFRH